MDRRPLVALDAALEKQGVRKPLARSNESKEVLPVRLHPSVIAGLKERALRKGIGHTTLAREYLITGMSMDDAQEFLKGNTRVTA